MFNFKITSGKSRFAKKIALCETYAKVYISKFKTPKH